MIPCLAPPSPVNHNLLPPLAPSLVAIPLFLLFPLFLLGCYGSYYTRQACWCGVLWRCVAPVIIAMLGCRLFFFSLLFLSVFSSLLPTECRYLDPVSDLDYGAFKMSSPSSLNSTRLFPVFFYSCPLPPPPHAIVKSNHTHCTSIPVHPIFLLLYRCLDFCALLNSCPTSPFSTTVVCKPRL